ncbi:MAG: OmpP1/FadL family transporter [Candidatus Aminicenantaceae bacterium]
MKRVKKLLAIAIVLPFLITLAFSNGLNLNGLGSKAVAMGGAFVALADDYSAIFWNPAGIAQFNQKTFGFFGEDIIPSGTYKFDITLPIIGPFNLVNAKTEGKHYLNATCAYYHPVSENLVAGFGVYVPSGLGAKWNGEDFKNISENTAYKWESYINIITFSPALAFKISEQVFFGATLNINYGTFNVDMHAGTTVVPLPPPFFFTTVDLGQYEEKLKGWGYGATFGILVKPSEMFSLGATFRTPTKMKFKGDASISNLNLLGANKTSDVDRDVTWPMWIAGGVAIKPVENLTITADVQYTNWKKIEVLKADYKDPVWKQIMAISGDDTREMHWKDATQIRFGAEYRVNSLALRAGYYNDPAPAPDKTMNVLLPNYDFSAVAFGIGYAANGLYIDFALEYLKAKDRDIDYSKTLLDPEWKTAMPGVHTMKIWAPSFSIGYNF